MEYFKRYKLEKNRDGYTLILYLDIGLMEFADEFGESREEQARSLDRLIGDYIKEKFPNIKINTVKLMAGSIVVATIMLQSGGDFAEANTNATRPAFHMTYVYFETGDALIGTLSRTGQILDAVLPDYFNLDSEGKLQLTCQFDPYTIKEMQKRNLKVVPFLSNHWDRAKGQAALRNRESLVKEIVQVINDYDLDGINVDMENLLQKDRENHVLFVKALRESLPRDKEVSVAVAANPKGFTTGWHGSYDYKELGKYADYLFIMAYDEHYDGGSPGPVASIKFVEDSIKYALRNVPSEKIVLGLPFFGRIWKDDGCINGRGLSLIKIEELINKYNGKVSYDRGSQSPVATVNITGYEDNLPKGKYTIWFENEESILHKLRLVENYNIKGAGSWSLHQATQDIWDIYNQWMERNNVFVDIKGHWAMPEILAVSDRGWMVGTEDFYFEPDIPLTRAQAATLLVRAMELERDNTPLPYFNDIPNSHWARKYIDIAVQHQLMEGRENQEFAPDEPITREEMATLLTRVLEVTPSDKMINNPFRDIDIRQWSYPFVKAMAEEGIFQGFDDGTFRPKDKITRAQMTTLLERIKDRY